MSDAKITKVALQPIKMGYRLVDGETEDVFNPDLQVLLCDWDGTGRMRQIGYAWFRPSRFISFDTVRGATDEDKATVKRLVEELTGQEFERVTAPPDEPEEDDDEPEDDEDE
ncbi:hypothetical protein [Planctomycetes bacterium TBK1r]|uniref:Uncharacterized protein n=1 Tax=Stieleria magnilauensis TaxID=2527963 RepID=A0ABX5XY08_9BACT|nr:hypothetical protein TBK1r_59440 [Planctomycetes bacterium TBK1r]QDV86995.1 hypothetical protein TBK1r_60220 [Planctomycetes bacterium TBK1r]